MSFIEQSLAAHAKKAGSNGEAGLCCPQYVFDVGVTDPDYDDEPIANVFLEEEEKKKIIRPIWKKGRNYDESVESVSLVETSSRATKAGSSKEIAMCVQMISKRRVVVSLQEPCIHTLFSL